MNYYTCETVEKIPQEVLEVCYAYTASSKNIYNSTLYLIRQLTSSYTKNITEESNNLVTYRLKDSLHANTIEVLNIANKTIKKYR